jgi:hypothetical protein
LIFLPKNPEKNWNLLGDEQNEAVGILVMLFASFCCAQDSGDFHPASTNVWGEYPKLIVQEEYKFV